MNCKTLLAESLKGVRRGARFIGAAAEKLRAGLRYALGDSNACSRLSTEHGPAIMARACAAKGRVRTREADDVLSGFVSRLTNL